MSNFPPPPGPGTPPGFPEPGNVPGPFGPPTGSAPYAPAGPPAYSPSPQTAPPGFGTPLSSQQSPMPTPTPDPSTPPWKKWWFAVGALVVVGGIVTAIVVATSDKDTPKIADVTVPAEVTDPTFDVTVPSITVPEITIPDITVDVTIPSITITEVTEPTATDDTSADTVAVTEPTESTNGGDTDDLVVGESASVEEGSTVRLNSVTPNVPVLDEFFTPDEGNTLTRLDVEGCAGSDGLYFNSLYWQGFAEDNTSIDSFLFGGDLPTIEIAPGACIRGTIDLEVPPGKTVVSVVMQGSLFQEAARWNTAETVPVTGPLTAATPVSTLGLSEPATVADGATAVVKSVQSNAPPLDDFFPAGPGRQLVRADVEVCAGSAPLDVGPIYWYVSATDNRTGEATYASTLTSIQIGAGECAAGLVELDLPADAVVNNIILTDSSLTEAARFRVA